MRRSSALSPTNRNTPVALGLPSNRLRKTRSAASCSMALWPRESTLSKLGISLRTSVRRGAIHFSPNQMDLPKSSGEMIPANLASNGRSFALAGLRLRFTSSKFPPVALRNAVVCARVVPIATSTNSTKQATLSPSLIRTATRSGLPLGIIQHSESAGRLPTRPNNTCK